MLAALIVAAVFVSGALPALISSVPALAEPAVSFIPGVAAGGSHSVGLKSDGTVLAVGEDVYGQCDVDAWADVKQVAAGGFHTVGLKSDGTVLAVGQNGDGQCNVDGWTNIVQVAAGYLHTVGLKSDGTVVAVGNNGSGQCNTTAWTGMQQVAAGSYRTAAVKSDGTVVIVGFSDPVGSWDNIVQVDTDIDHTVGLRSDGTVVAAGGDYYGQCDVSAWIDIKQVSTGEYYTVGLRFDGTVVAVGDNTYGQRDVDAWTSVVQVSAGYIHTVGLKSDGTVVAAGMDSHGQCDVGGWDEVQQVSAGYFHTVGLKSDGTVLAVGERYNGACDVGGWTDMAQVSAGDGYTVGLKSDGTVVTLGSNYYGRCNVDNWTGIVQVAAGYNHTVGLESDNTVVAVGDSLLGRCDVGDWTGIVQVSAGYDHTVGLKSDGTVVAVGGNSYLQCEVSSWSDIMQVAAGRDFTVGVKSDGSVIITGTSTVGPWAVGDWTGIEQVAAGFNSTVGLKSGGTVVAAGSNLYGQCNVTSWADVQEVSAGREHTVGLNPDGTVVAVGRNNVGQCNTLIWELGVALEVDGVSAEDKTYDGTTVATLDTSAATLEGVIAGDNVTLVTAGATGTFSDKNVGVGKTVTVSGLTITGSDAGNYHLVQATTMASITPASLTVTGVTANDKTYDGSITAALNTSGAALLGTISGDNVTLVSSGGIGTFADKNVGAGKAVSVSGLTLSGPDAGNYFLVQPAATADVTQRPLLVTATGINKTYDGAASASVTLSDDRVSGDSLTVSSVAAFADKHVGSNKTVNVSGISISGPDAGNYSLSSTAATTTGSILPRSLAITGITAADKVYDGYAGASLNTSSAALAGVLSGDDVTLVTSDVVGSFPDKNAGTAKTVTVSGITLSGSDAGNYSLSQITITASILVKPLTVKDIIADSKTHDGTSAATLDFSSANLLGLVSGDDVTLVTSGATGVFEDEAVGNGKTVTVSGLTLSGSDAGNYSLAGYTTTADIYQPTADIGPAGGANWGLIIGAVVALLAVAGVTGWLVVRRRNRLDGANSKT